MRNLLALLGSAWVYRVESEHAEHEAHIRAEHDGELPPPPAYDYLNKRAKPFPWGPNSLFFNRRVRLLSCFKYLDSQLMCPLFV